MITRNSNLAEALNASIQGVVTVVPKGSVANIQLPPGADDAARLTGVQHRRRASAEDTTESMCLAAAQRLMAELEWKSSSVRALVYVTQTPGLAVPASAFGLHRSLNLPQSAPALQVNWSCAGYVYGLWLAMQLARYSGDRVLLLVGDTSSSITDPFDRATGPLFGDAGSATAVVGDRVLSHFVLGNDGMRNEQLQQKRGEFLHMDGAGVMSFALQQVPRLIEDVLNIAPSPDYLLFHQANRFMLDQVVRKSKLLERFTTAQIPSNVERFGNCSCASIPLLLCDMVGQQSAQLSRFALFGFGSGWAWAGAVISGMRMDVCELIEV